MYFEKTGKFCKINIKKSGKITDLFSVFEPVSPPRPSPAAPSSSTCCDSIKRPGLKVLIRNIKILKYRTNIRPVPAAGSGAARSQLRCVDLLGFLH